MVQSLDKKWKEVLYAMSGFGPNFLMVLMGAYFTDAINPVALGLNSSYQAIMTGTCFIMPAIFPILYAISKAFDGLIDVPFAHVVDTLSTKWGRRRPPIAICFIPMVVSYFMCWWPIGGADGQLFNTIWIFIWALVFFSSYTMCMIAFYGSLSTTCSTESQRLRVSSFKSFFDTISYCLVYALVPVMLSGFKITIDKFAFISLPLMLTMTIPLFIIKEGEKYGYPENEGLKPEKITIGQSLKITFKNKLFSSWLLVNCCSFFGLQMFLTSMNSLIIGGMGFVSWEMTLINTFAFAPVPIMLYLISKIKAKKGLRFTYQLALVSFAIAILSFDLGSLYVTGGNKPVQYIIGCLGGLLGSFGIGTFFTIQYHIPAQISATEEKLLGVNHSAMYFAGQAVTTTIVGAIASSLVYENIKMLFISKSASGVVYAENISKASEMFGVDVSTVYNLGTLLAPIIVCVMCLIGCILAFRMPKDYTPEIVAQELKKSHPELNIDEYIKTAEHKEKGEIVFVQVALSILSGFIFGFVWLGFMLKSLKELKLQEKSVIQYLLCAIIPFYAIYWMLKLNKNMQSLALEKNIKIKNNKVLYIISGLILPILPLNIVALAFIQNNLNKILEA